MTVPATTSDTMYFIPLTTILCATTLSTSRRISLSISRIELL